MFILTTPIVIFYCHESWFHNIVIISTDRIWPFVNDTATVGVVDRLYKLSQVSSRHPFIPFKSGSMATARTIWKNIIGTFGVLFIFQTRRWRLASFPSSAVVRVLLLLLLSCAHYRACARIVYRMVAVAAIVAPPHTTSSTLLIRIVLEPAPLPTGESIVFL